MKKKKSAIYVRVSTNYQVDKDSLPLQRQDLINYSKYVLGIDEYEIFEDAGFSGKNTSRPAFQEMIERIRTREFSHLLVWKIDRISRNLLDFCNIYEEIKKYDCTFISKNEQFDTSSAMGEAMLKIILVFAELERKLTGERVTAVMLDRANKGLWNGAPIPLGYKWDKEKKFPVIDENESRTIKIIFNKYRDTQSTSIVRNELNEIGLKTKRGGSWTTKTLADIIRNPFYKGTYRYNYRESARGAKKKKEEWVLVDDNHQGIISKELWQECNEIMDKNAASNNARFRSNSKTHVFASILECGECHNNLYAKEDKANKDGFRPSIYVCSSRYNNSGCKQKTISDKVVGSFVLKYISNIIKLSESNVTNIDDIQKVLLSGKVFNDVIAIDKDSLSSIIKLLNIKSTNIFSKKVPDKKVMNKEIIEIKNLNKQKEKFERALERLEDLYLFDDESMSEKDYILKKKKLNEKLDDINKKLSDISSENEIEFNTNLIENAKSLILILELKKNSNINYKKLVTTIGKALLKELVNSVINKIIVKDKKVLSIEFKNGLVSKFIYAD